MRENAKVTLVFDGDRQGGNAGAGRSNVKVIFSKPPEKADPVIKRMADKPSANEERIVVTSDQEIVRFARQCSVSSIASKAFAQVLIQPKQKKRSIEMKYERGLSAKETESWMNIFQNQTSEFDEGGSHDD